MRKGRSSAERERERGQDGERDKWREEEICQRIVSQAAHVTHLQSCIPFRWCSSKAEPKPTDRHECQLDDMKVNRSLDLPDCARPWHLGVGHTSPHTPR